MSRCDDDIVYAEALSDVFIQELRPVDNLCIIRRALAIKLLRTGSDGIRRSPSQ